MNGDRDSFVVWIDPPGDSPSACCGHVEHVRTATRVRFSDGEELLRFLQGRSRAALVSADAAEADRPRGGASEPTNPGSASSAAPAEREDS